MKNQAPQGDEGRRRSPAAPMRRILLMGMLIGLGLQLAGSALAQTVVAYFTDNEPSATGMAAPITKAGFVPLHVDNIATLSLTNLGLLCINEFDNNVVSAALQARLAEIQTWVSNGGRLIIHDRSAGNLLPNPFLLGTPGTFTVRFTTADLDVIPPATNPVVAGPFGTINNNTLDGGNWSAHGYVPRASLPPGASPFLSVGGSPDEVVAFSYVLGAGAIYYSAIPLDCYLPGASCAGITIAAPLQNIYTPNVLAYFASLAAAPKISQQPGSQTAFQGDDATFAVTASGGGLSYQWRFGGAPILGATDTTLLLTNVALQQAGVYSVAVSNAYGSVTSSNATLSVIPTVPLPVALNATGLVWVTDGAANWHGLTNVSHDRVAAGQGGPILDSQVTRLRTTVTGPGTLTFWWKVASEANADFLTLSVGGTAQAAISGEVDWEQRTLYLPVGTQTVEWTYSKDAHGSAGQDKAWVDEVLYTGGASIPFIVTQPASQSSLGGAPVTFTVTAGGTPQLRFQWRFNGSNIAGATLSSFTIANPGAGDNGPYSVQVTNAYGSILSSNALLGVVPMVASGDNYFGQLNVSAGATNAVAIAAGAWHSLALRADGAVLAWGNNSAGQSDVPPNLAGVVAIAAGGYHNLALKADRTVIGWGADFYGQASPPANLSNVLAIAAGTWHSLALRADGAVVGWGDNSSGQTTVPPQLANVIAIAACGSHSLALRADGTVAAWGENTDAQGLYVGQSVVPPGLSNVVAIGAGEYHSLAAKSDGTVVAWGDDSQGQSQPPPSLAGEVAVAGGGSHSLALKSNGTVAAWGANWNGQCNLSPALAGVVAMAAGSAHTLLLLGNATAPPQLLYPARAPNQFSIVLQTFSGKTYTLEYKSSLAATNWTPAATVRGNGALQFLTDPAATVPQRFYRVRQQ